MFFISFNQRNVYIHNDNKNIINDYAPVWNRRRLFSVAITNSLSSVRYFVEERLAKIHQIIKTDGLDPPVETFL